MFIRDHRPSSPFLAARSAATALALGCAGALTPANAFDNFPLTGDEVVATYCPDMIFDPISFSWVPDPKGFVVETVDVSGGSPPVDSNWLAPRFWNAGASPITNEWTWANLGNVFAVTLDKSTPPNIYVAASTTFGQFPHTSGPLVGPSGPGAVYKISGVTGAITTWLTLPNTGPGLGDICYDRFHGQFFVSNFEDGTISRVKEIGNVGVVQQVFDPFAADNDGDAGFAPLGERVWALEVINSRVLMFSVWLRDRGRQSTPWPASWGAQGSLPANNALFITLMSGSTGVLFGTFSKLVAVLPYLPTQTYSNPVSDLASSYGGEISVAERLMLGDIGIAGQGHEARVLEYIPIPGSFPGGGAGSLPISPVLKWRVGEYPSWFGSGQNAAGGTSIDTAHRVWVSGDALHFAGSDYIYGLQRIAAGGNAADLTPTTLGNLVDLDGDISYVPKGQPGDVEFSPAYIVNWLWWNVACAGDVYGLACPCGNSGDVDHGCANSVDPRGALLSVSGVASVSADTCVLAGSGMPNGTALYFQGASVLGEGFGVPFGDGQRCVTGSVIRLSYQMNAGGASQHPSPADVPISIGGGVMPGEDRYYQVWYRNSDPTFCPPSMFNLSNAVSITWSP